ncbi:MAG: ATP-binding cassette domain-containing protein [Janthinobacterium lividum]
MPYGSRIDIIGRGGSGKSTLLKMITLLLIIQI